MFGKLCCPFVGAAVSLCAVFSSCSEKVVVEDFAGGTMLTVSTAVVVASAEGGTYSVTYSVINPVQGGEVSCIAGDDWIRNVDCSVMRTVSFTVDGNTAVQPREGSLTVTYEFEGGSADAVVILAQNAAGSPELTLSPAAIAASVEGGEYTFSYIVENPVPDAVLTCTADAQWVGGFDLSADGAVTFSVDENKENELRTCQITLSYAFDGGVSNGSVTLVQNHFGGGLSVDDLIGTYEASAVGYDPESNSFVETVWTMTIYENYAPTVTVDGIVPAAAGYYDPADEEPVEAYIAEAFLDSYGRLIVPSQFTGYAISPGGNYYYIGYTPCVEYDGSGAYIDGSGPDCVFTYDSSTKTWTSDYGMFLGLFTSYSFNEMALYSDLVVPTITLKKTDSAPAALSTLGPRPALGELKSYNAFKIR